MLVRRPLMQPTDRRCEAVLAAVAASIDDDCYTHATYRLIGLFIATQPTTSAEEDDFSWDADEEDGGAKSPKTAEPATKTIGVPAVPSASSSAITPTLPSQTTSSPAAPASSEATPSQTQSQSGTGKSAATSTNTSPRESEESYDIVSDQNGSGLKKLTAAAKVEDSTKAHAKESSDESDDDWE